jgi:hypothetical protein
MKLIILAVGLLLVGTNLYAADGDLIVNGNVGVGTLTPQAKVDVVGGIKVSSPSFYVTTGSCPPGDSAVAYRTAPLTCSITYACGDGETCTGTCTTGNHDWGTGTTAETCQYTCSSAFGAPKCTCSATKLALCNP